MPPAEDLALHYADVRFGRAEEIQEDHFLPSYELVSFSGMALLQGEGEH
jgi:hypothetical protein